MGTVRTVAELAALYDEPLESSLAKEADHLVDLHRRYVEASPFVLVATNGPDGLDCSPRGDAPGFVRVADDGRTLLLPDRRGNNRLDCAPPGPGRVGGGPDRHPRWTVHLGSGARARGRALSGGAAAVRRSGRGIYTVSKAATVNDALTASSPAGRSASSWTTRPSSRASS